MDVLGDRLTGAGGQTLLQRGDSEAEVVGRLGGGKEKSSYRPGGSGVISCSRQRAGGEHVYEDGTTRYTISVYEDRLASVRAQPLRPLIRRSSDSGQDITRMNRLRLVQTATRCTTVDSVDNRRNGVNAKRSKVRRTSA